MGAAWRAPNNSIYSNVSLQLPREHLGMPGGAVGSRRCPLKEAELWGWLPPSTSHYLSSCPGAFTAISLPDLQRQRLSPQSWSCPIPARVQGKGLEQPGRVELGWNKMGLKVPSSPKPSMVLGLVALKKRQGKGKGLGSSRLGAGITCWKERGGTKREQFSPSEK